MSYIEPQDLPDNERVFLKKDMFGWRVVAPIKIDGKINWYNLLTGGTRGLVFLIILLLMFGMYYLGTKELISNYKKVVDNPCSFCIDCQVHTLEVLSQQNRPMPIAFSMEDLKGLIINDS